MTETTRKQLLTGRNNFLSWLTRLEGLLTIDDIIERTDEGIVILGATPEEKKKNEREAKRYVLKNCDDSVMHVISPSDSFFETIEKLNSAYGFGNLDPSTIMKELRSIKFHPSRNPSVIFEFIDKKTVELESSGGAISDSQLVEFMHDGLSGDPQRDTFWFNCRGQMAMNGLSTYTSETAKNYIQKYWYAFKIDHRETANHVEVKRSWERRHCTLCAQNRPKIAGTHNIEKCRFKTNETANMATQKGQSDNKPTQECSNLLLFSNPKESIFHDSGSSKTMINFKPQEAKPVNVPVYTAGTYQEPQIGTNIGKSSSDH